MGDTVENTGRHGPGNKSVKLSSSIFKPNKESVVEDLNNCPHASC